MWNIWVGSTQRLDRFCFGKSTTDVDANILNIVVILVFSVKSVSFSYKRGCHFVTFGNRIVLYWKYFYYYDSVPFQTSIVTTKSFWRKNKRCFRLYLFQNLPIKNLTQLRLWLATTSSDSTLTWFLQTNIFNCCDYVEYRYLRGVKRLSCLIVVGNNHAEPRNMFANGIKARGLTTSEKDMWGEILERFCEATMNAFET